MNIVSEDFNYGDARLNEVVEQILRAAIADHSIPQGALLAEARLADFFDLSRAPVQQALKRLERDKIVEKVDGKGYFVGSAGDRADAAKPWADIPIPAEARSALLARAGWEKIYPHVERDIVGMMAFGRHNINELALAEYYGVSRTVTRDVLSRLETAGLLEKSQRSHWAVPRLDARLMKDLYQMRRLLEPAALLDAAEVVDRDSVAAMVDRLRDAEARYPDVDLEELAAFEDDLHVKVIGSCRNKRILSALQQSQVPLVATAYLFQLYLGIPEDEPFLVEHRLVLELLAQGTPQPAAAALDAHLASALGKGLKRLEFLSHIKRPEAPPYLQPAV